MQESSHHLSAAKGTETGRGSSAFCGPPPLSTLKLETGGETSHTIVGLLLAFQQELFPCKVTVSLGTGCLGYTCTQQRCGFLAQKPLYLPFSVWQQAPGTARVFHTLSGGKQSCVFLE